MSVRLTSYAVTAISLAMIIAACSTPPRVVKSAPQTPARETLPDKDFTHPPEKPHDPADLFFHFDQLDHYYRVPGEFTHRLTGDQYGFESLSFIISETHPGGGPGLHTHDVEEAHILLEGTAQYRIGDKTFTVQAPYVARVPAGIPHTFINAGTTPFNLIAVFASNHPNTQRIGPNPLVAQPPNEDPPVSTLPSESPMLTITEKSSVTRVWTDGTVEYPVSAGVLRRRVSNTRIAHLKEMLESEPKIKGGYLSYVPPGVSEVLVKVALPQRTYDVVAYLDACGVFEKQVFLFDGGPSGPPSAIPTAVSDPQTDPAAFVNRLIQQLPFKRCYGANLEAEDGH